MGFAVTFNEQNYKEALKNNRCKVVGFFPPFIKVNRVSYDKLRRKSTLLEFEHVKSRVSKKLFENLRSAVGFTLRHARTYFPAYRFFVNEYLNDEWLATVDWHKKFHRDHIIHQTMSVYVGLSLLKGADLSNNITSPSILFNDKTLLELSLDAIHSSECQYLKNRLKEMGGSHIFFENTPAAKILWENMFLESFFLATLFHDMGYPWVFVQNINKKLDPHFPADPSVKDAKWLADNYHERLLLYPLYGYEKPVLPIDDSINALIDQCLRETHGISGAISLLYLNDILTDSSEEYDCPERRFCIEWAAMAVMMHDMGKIYSKIDEKKIPVIENPQLRLSIDKDPLSFALTLTDQIQDFERPDSFFYCSTDREDESICTYSSKCKSVILELDDSKDMKIRFLYEDAGIFFKNKEIFLPATEAQYFDPNTGYLDYKNLGISRILLIPELLP